MDYKNLFAKYFKLKNSMPYKTISQDIIQNRNTFKWISIFIKQEGKIMNIVFCHMGAESMGIEYLSAVLKSKGHQVTLVFDPKLFDDKYYLHIKPLAKIFNKKKALVHRIKAINPDIICFTVLTDTYKWACSFAKEIKKAVPDKYIIFGGVHPTSVPEIVIKNDFVDAVCIGEGEDAILEFVEAINRTDIKNFWFKKDGKIIKNKIRPLRQDLDALPFPDKSIFENEISLKTGYLIAANRCCPFSCTYCFSNYYTSLYKGQKIVRQRSVENVIEELRIAKKRFGIKSVYFVDDVFCINQEYLLNFFDLYRQHINLPFKIISHPAVITDEMVKTFKKSGCFNLEIGIQSMCQQTRKDILHRYETNEAIIKAVNILESNKMPYTLHHIFGLPNDDYAKLLAAAEFYHNLKYCTKIDCYWLSYFPKTEIVDISQKLGLINQKDIDRINNGDERMYFEGGSVRDKKMQRLCKNFDIFFQLCPFLPKALTKLLFKKRVFNYFYLLPDFTITAANLANAVKNKDSRTFDYIKYYYRHIIKFK